MSQEKRYAHIENNKVTNVSLWDGVTHWEPDCQIIELLNDSPVGPGWIFDGSDWIAPPAPEIL